MQPEILILAAGSSSRMRGDDKLLQQIDGQPLISRIARASLATGVPVTVALAPDRPQRESALAGLAVRKITVPNPEQGMAISLQAGLSALPEAASVLLLLADLPEITGEDLALFLTEWQATPDLILRATSASGTPGHPVGFPAWVRADLAGLQGDAGARAVLARHKASIRFIALPGNHATTDLDTPEDWAQWRALRGQ